MRVGKFLILSHSIFKEDMNSDIIIARQVISLIDKYLKYYPMDQYYNSDQTTYLNGYLKTLF